MTEENLILGRDVVEDCRDCGQADIEWIQRMFHNWPHIKLQQELQARIGACQLATAESDHVENRLTNCIENDVRFWILISVEIAVLHVAVRPVAELSEVKLHGVEGQKVGA